MSKKKKAACGASPSEKKKYINGNGSYCAAAYMLFFYQIFLTCSPY